MANRADALEDLRIAKMILQIAKENNYHKVIVYLENNVRKAQEVLDSLDRFSPSKMLNEFFEILAPQSPKESNILPFTVSRCMVPLKEVVVVDYHQPHCV